MSKSKKDPFKKLQKSWQDLMPPAPDAEGIPEGYSTADEIARKHGMSATNARMILRKAREEGGVDVKRVRVGPQRKWAYVYKD
jgi:hypothetical protein